VVVYPCLPGIVGKLLEFGEQSIGSIESAGTIPAVGGVGGLTT
jgi:hypothetical protein